MSIDRITPPWTEEQVDALNWFQRHSGFHPFTCGGNRSDEWHKQYDKDAQDSDNGILLATKDGWVCPVCDYKQGWAHVFMAARPANPFLEYSNSLKKDDEETHSDGRSGGGNSDG